LVPYGVEAGILGKYRLATYKIALNATYGVGEHFQALYVFTNRAAAFDGLLEGVVVHFVRRFSLRTLY
jgi:hypothetical protein